MRFRPRTHPRPRNAERVRGRGDRGAIAASLIEIGVAMLAVGILSAGALTSFSGFIDRSADTSARSLLSDSLTVADSVYNHLRAGGKRCYSDTNCGAITNASMVTAMKAEAGGELKIEAAVATGFDPATATAGTIYVQVAEPTTAAHLPGNDSPSLLRGTTVPAGKTVGTKLGDWIRLMVKSDSGATFCVLKITQSDNPAFEGVGYMSVNSDDSATAKTGAHCGGRNAASSQEAAAGAEICVYGSTGGVKGGKDAAAAASCGKTHSGLTKPSASGLTAASWA